MNDWWACFKQWWHRPHTIRFMLTDPDYGDGVTGELTVYKQGIGIRFDGFHMLEADDAHAELIWIEQYNKRLTVTVWPDSLAPDPQTISLEPARVAV